MFFCNKGNTSFVVSSYPINEPLNIVRGLFKAERKQSVFKLWYFFDCCKQDVLLFKVSFLKS